MKKSILKNEINFGSIVDITYKIKNNKLSKIDINDSDKEFIKKNMIKKEYIESCKENIINIDTDMNRTSIQKYESFYLISESINYHATAYKQETHYYKLSY